MRTLVRWALKQDSAEQLGLKLRQRYERQQRRHGIEPADTRAETESAEQLDKLFCPLSQASTPLNANRGGVRSRS